jgi:ribosome-binding factor A
MSLRQEKYNRLLQKELGNIFIEKSTELAPGALLTVTGVRISPDLGYAKVYISIFPQKLRNESFENIQNRNTEIRRALGFKISKQVRIIPELAFFIDDSLDHAERIDELLKP